MRVPNCATTMAWAQKAYIEVDVKKNNQFYFSIFCMLHLLRCVGICDVFSSTKTLSLWAHGIAIKGAIMKASKTSSSSVLAKKIAKIVPLGIKTFAKSLLLVAKVQTIFFHEKSQLHRFLLGLGGTGRFLYALHSENLCSR